MELTDSVIVITGAASGIGAALARRLDREQPRAMALLDLNEAGLAALAAELRCDTVELCGGDAADVATITQLVRSLERRFGAIDLFCANAGIFPAGGVELPLAAWQRAMEINLFSHLHAVNACLPAMLARGRGHFLHTISAAGLLSQLGSAPYTVTKHAALALAEWVAITHGDAGIGVTALCPQGVDTPMLGDIDAVASVAGDGLLSAAAVADCAVAAVEEGRFLALPHPQVAEYMRRRAADHERWLRGMRRLQAGMNEAGEPDGSGRHRQ